MNPGPAPGVADAVQASIAVVVVRALPDRQARVDLRLPATARVADALVAAAQSGVFEDLDLAGVTVGIYGEVVDHERRLADHDRVEIYRPLLTDPVQARRLRGRAQS